MNSTNSTIAETLATNKNRYISGIVISSVFLIVYFIYLIGCFIYYGVKKIKGLTASMKKKEGGGESTIQLESNSNFNFDLEKKPQEESP